MQPERWPWEDQCHGYQKCDQNKRALHRLLLLAYRGAGGGAGEARGWPGGAGGDTWVI